MTNSGDNDFHRNNDLGGRKYTDSEQLLIHMLSAGLRARDPDLDPLYVHGLGVRPRDYIPAYTKIAGFVYELAKNLVAYPFPSRIRPKTLEEWIEIVTAIKLSGTPVPKQAIADGVVDKEGALHIDLGTKVVSQPIESIELTIDLRGLQEEPQTFRAEKIVEPEEANSADPNCASYVDAKGHLFVRGPDGLMHEIGVPYPKPMKVKRTLEDIDPEKAKAILLRVADLFPGLYRNGEEPVSGSDLVQELSILIQTSL